MVKSKKKRTIKKKYVKEVVKNKTLKGKILGAFSKKKEELKLRYFLNKERQIEFKERKLEFRKTYATTVIAALSFVAGLFWKDAITAALDVLPETTSLFSKIIVASIITGLFVLLIVVLNARINKLQDRLEKDKKKLDREVTEEGID